MLTDSLTLTHSTVCNPETILVNIPDDAGKQEELTWRQFDHGTAILINPFKLQRATLRYVVVRNQAHVATMHLKSLAVQHYLVMTPWKKIFLSVLTEKKIVIPHFPRIQEQACAPTLNYMIDSRCTALLT